MLAVKPPEGGQFQLPGALLEAAEVFEEDQDLAGAAGRPLETGANFAARRRPEIHGCARTGVLPASQSGRQRRAGGGQRGHRCERRPEQCRCGRVVPLHATGRIDDENAVLHPLDHALADPPLILQRDPALSRQLLVDHDPLAEQPRHDGSSKKAGRQQSGLDDACRVEAAKAQPVGLDGESRQSCQCRIEQHQPTAPDQAGGRQRNQQQRPDAAGDAATGMHQEADGDDVGKHLQRELHVEAVLPVDRGEQAGGDRGEVDTCREQ